jgi:quinolinate synthase
MDEPAIRALHADHTRSSIAALVERLHYFEQGVCVVHHAFDDKVVETLRRGYSDALVAAHLEVPRDMFAYALEAQRNGSGVVGSTANILQFIEGATLAAARRGEPRHLRFVLGTEPGMVTAIVRRVRSILKDNRDRDADQAVEIIFPISSDAGVPESEGRSEAGGSAVCPYMKMNSLDALLDLLGQIGSTSRQALERFEPRKYSELINGRSVAELGRETILHMSAFQRTKRLPDALVEDIQTRGA